jgi:hypothetical protein
VKADGVRATLATATATRPPEIRTLFEQDVEATKPA